MTDIDDNEAADVVKKAKAELAKDENSFEFELARYVAENVIGQKTTFRGPFGRKRVVYCDNSTTGRPLKFIEAFMVQEVLPSYSDQSMTTISNVTALQTALYLDEAKNIFRHAINCGSDDEIIFSVSSRHAILQNLINRLQLFAPIIFVATNDCQDQRPWARTGAEIVQIPLSCEEGRLDIEYLKAKLEFYRNSDRQLLGCFSAACPLTGILQNDLAITRLLHSYGALSVWDYSTAAPFTVIDMNPQVPGDFEGVYHKDAIYFQTENFIGGMNSCGVLAVKKVLLKPSEVDQPTDVQKTVSETLGPIRGGLALQLKEAIGPKYIMKQQARLTSVALEKLSKSRNIILLGNKHLPHLATYSMVVKNPVSGLYLHHKFVCTLLNDLYGIQARTGIAMDSRHGKYLFNISEEMSNILTHPHLESVQPGFVIVDLPWYATFDEVDYVLEAIRFIASDDGGWKLLPQYIYNQETSEWHHHTNLAFSDKKWLSKITYDHGKFEFKEKQVEYRSALTHQELLLKARNVVKDAEKVAHELFVPNQVSHLPEDFQRLRWFLLPLEAQIIIKKFGKFVSSPTCADRLTIRRYPKAKAISLEVNPIGTLDGRAVFEPTTLSKRNSAEHPVHRRPWLSRGTDSKLHSQQQQPQTVSSEDEDSKSRSNEPESEDPIPIKDELVASKIEDKKAENEIEEESAKQNEQQNADDEKVPETEKMSVPEKSDSTELNNSDSPTSAGTATAVVATGSDPTKSTPTETVVVKTGNESPKSKEAATSSWMARFDSWRMFERIGPTAKDQQKTENQSVPEQTNTENVHVVPKPEAVTAKGQQDVEDDQPGEEENNEVNSQIVVVDNIRVSQMEESMKAEFESVLNVNNNNNRFEKSYNQEVVLINNSLDCRRMALESIPEEEVIPKDDEKPDPEIINGTVQTIRPDVIVPAKSGDDKNKKSKFSGFFSKFKNSNNTDRTANGPGTPRPSLENVNVPQQQQQQQQQPEIQTYLYGWDEQKVSGR